MTTDRRPAAHRLRGTLVAVIVALAAAACSPSDGQVVGSRPVAPAVGSGGLVTGSRGPVAGSGGPVAAPAKAAHARRTAPCTTAGLAVWLGVGDGGHAAGSSYLPIELTNTSQRACHLRGHPGVSAYGAGQIGSPARRVTGFRARTVTLQPGATAHALLQIVVAGNYPAARCGPVEAAGLRVYPPGQRTAAFVPYAFPACSKATARVLFVRPVQPGVGIPGAP
jgi:Protein of unknown function (DUF4232)